MSADLEIVGLIMSNETLSAEVGKIYDITHSRKGKFTARIVRIVGDSADVEIISGKVIFMSHGNQGSQEGELLRINTALCKFNEVKPI